MDDDFNSKLALLDGASSGFAQVITTINNAIIQEGESKTIAEYISAWGAITRSSLGMS